MLLRSDINDAGNHYNDLSLRRGKQGQIKTTLKHTAGSINAANLRSAHQLLESGTAIGKVVLEGWN